MPSVSDEPTLFDTYLDGHNFKGWHVYGTLYTTVLDVITAVKSSTDETITIYEVYDNKEGECQVTVKGGKLNDNKVSGRYQISKLMKATANPPENGKKFSHWLRNGKLVSYNETYRFYMPSMDVELEAEFVDAATSVEKKGTAFIESVTPKKDTNDIAFVSVVNVPADFTMVKGGLVATSDPDIGENVTEDNAAFVKLSAKITANTTNLKYTWTKTNVNET